MEKLEQSSGRKWRKFIVGLGNREIFEKIRFGRSKSRCKLGNEMTADLL